MIFQYYASYWHKIEPLIEISKSEKNGISIALAIQMMAAIFTVFSSGGTIVCCHLPIAIALPIFLHNKVKGIEEAEDLVE